MFFLLDRLLFERNYLRLLVMGKIVREIFALTKILLAVETRSRQNEFSANISIELTRLASRFAQKMN